MIAGYLGVAHRELLAIAHEARCKGDPDRAKRAARAALSCEMLDLDLMKRRLPRRPMQPMHGDRR